MKEIGIIEGNKLIAEFMEWEISGPGFASGYVNPHNTYCHFEDLKFHSSWDWLMPVVEKCLTISVESEEYEIHYAFIHDALWSINIKSVFDEVVEFIKWYNSCQKEK